MSLLTYQRKRHFDRTEEPRGGSVTGRPGRSSTMSSFVVQKHAASRLHYDFRLEVDGVLKSWAVPKGPSLDPAEKRLAVQVEDHPIEYGGFEGTIPQGEYGGGTVMVWDHGTWQPKPGKDPASALRDGKIEFTLHGSKLTGAWTLVRMGASRPSDKPQWLLRKTRDGSARSHRDYDVIEQLPTSAQTGRTLEEIASGKGSRAVWRSKGSASKPGLPAASQRSKRSAKAGGKSSMSATGLAAVPRAVRAPMPRELAPQLATLVQQAPAGDEWIHEVKFDGYRMLAFVRDGKARLISRNGKDWTTKLAPVARAVESLGLSTAILDGEVVAVDAVGRTSFQWLQGVLTGEPATGSLAYYLFDLPYLEGWDLRESALTDRRSSLHATLERTRPPRSANVLRFSEAINGRGQDVMHHACKLALEGIVSKRGDSAYSSGRGMDWVKSKCTNRQEMVIGGYAEPQGSRTGFGALLLGYFTGDDLVYAGRVGTGFDRASLARLSKQLQRLKSSAPAFTDPPVGAEAHGVQWTRPELVCEVEFLEWTKDGRLRHPSFIEIRADKDARDVVRERRKPLAAADSKGRASRTSQPERSSTSESPATNTVLGVELTHPDRELFADIEVSKMELARYYEDVSAWMMPHVEGRPLSVVRCPGGQGATCFYQKNWDRGDTVGSHVRRIRLSNAAIDCLIPDEPSSLVWLVQRGSLEVHTWGCTEKRLEQPDRMVFDLDPSPELGWSAVVRAAQRTRALLKVRGLESVVKTTGGKGVHVVVMLAPSSSWDRVKSFSKGIADALVAAHPGDYVATMSKAKRKGRIFVDYLRNNRGATFVAPYSSRARPGAPVSMPVSWRQLPALTGATHFTVRNAVEYLKKHGDAWRGVGLAQDLPPVDSTRAGRSGSS